MLEPTTYPPTLPHPQKYSVLKQQASLLGLSNKVRPVEQTVAFSSRMNAAGVDMSASTFSGEDTLGLNDGSKNSVLVTYLADAWSWGAEM
jgi:hypothetical protein